MGTDSGHRITPDHSFYLLNHDEKVNIVVTKFTKGILDINVIFSIAFPMTTGSASGMLH
jgi:hypothetical protein